MSSSVDGGGEPADAITAEQFNLAAVSSGRTMQELADMLGVGRSMVHNYRNHGVSRPPRTVETVRRVMGVWLRDENGSPFAGYTDNDLTRELERRLFDLRKKLDDASRSVDRDESSE